MRLTLLTGSDFEANYPGNYTRCIAFSTVGEEPAVQARKAERADFFRRLTESRRGGVLVAYGDGGQVEGWLTFAEKEMARSLLWPCSRTKTTDRRLVVACLLVDPASRGRGIAGMLLNALEQLAGNWGYDAIESPCRDENTYDPDLTFQTPAPFQKRGYCEVDRYHCDLMYPAEFSVWERRVV